MQRSIRDKTQRLLNHAVSTLFLPSSSTKLEPLQTILLLDRSASMATADMKTTRLAAAQMAAIELVAEQLTSSVPSAFAVISFSNDAVMHHPFSASQSTRPIKAAINSIHLDDQTSIGSGLELAEDALSAANPAGKSRIILLSDGCDNGDTNPLVVAKRIKASGCLIFCRGIGKQIEVDEELLLDIASLDASGQPQYLFHSEESALVKDFAAIGRLTR